MTDGDLQREASDPTTPGERLEMLLRSYGSEPLVVDAVMRNPSIPWRLLRRFVIAHAGNPEARAGWHNPSLPLMMMAEPNPDYEEAACYLLRWAQCGQQYPPNEVKESRAFADRVNDVAHGVDVREPWQLAVHDVPPAEQARLRREARDWARHLASLFGLPWPERAP